MSCSRRSNVLVVALALVLAVFALTTNGCLRRETRDQDRMVDEFEGEPTYLCMSTRPARPDT